MTLLEKHILAAEYSSHRNDLPVRSFIPSGAPTSNRLILFAAERTKRDENENCSLWAEAAVQFLRFVEAWYDWLGVIRLILLWSN